MTLKHIGLSHKHYGFSVVIILIFNCKWIWDLKYRWCRAGGISPRCRGEKQLAKSNKSGSQTEIQKQWITKQKQTEQFIATVSYYIVDKIIIQLKLFWRMTSDPHNKNLSYSRITFLRSRPWVYGKLLKFIHGFILQTKTGIQTADSQAVLFWYGSHLFWLMLSV